jgi:hypothetical protein
MSTFPVRRTLVANAVSACAIAALSMAPALLPAQAPARPRFGALIGASLTTISDADLAGETGFEGGTVEAKRRVGFQVGAYLTHPLSSNVSLQPELHYIQKGTKVQATVTDVEGAGAVEGEVGLRFAYLEVPLLLRVDMGGQSLRPFFVAGPSVAYRVSCSLDVAAEGLSFGVDCDQGDNDPATSDDPFKKYDVGGIVGVGVAGTKGGRALSAQVRYSRSLISIARESIDDVSPKHTGISILFGIGF